MLHLRSGDAFCDMLDRGNETWWETSDALYARYRDAETAMLDVLLRPLRQLGRRIFGGIDRLDEFHLAIVKGGAWEGRRQYFEVGAGAPRPPSAAKFAPRNSKKAKQRASLSLAARRKAHLHAGAKAVAGWSSHS